MEIHEIPPVFDAHARVIVLGSFPSVVSRREHFFYANPQNRFWKVLAAVFEAPEPRSVEEKKALLTHNGVALWDVVASCDVTASADATIRNAVANDVAALLAATRATRIFTNGKTAKKYYDLLLRDALGADAIPLPSTSSANASYSLARLVDAWSRIRSD